MATTTWQGQWRALLRRPGYAGSVLTVSALRIVSLMFRRWGARRSTDALVAFAAVNVLAAAVVGRKALLRPARP